MFEDNEEAWAALADVMRKLATDLQAKMAPAVDVLARSMDGLWQAARPHLRAAYHVAGKPYGDDEAGMLRWWGERPEALRHREGEYAERLRRWAADDVGHYLATGEHLPAPRPDAGDA